MVRKCPLSFLLVMLVMLVMPCWCGSVAAQLVPYDPYADFEEAGPAVLPDGTLQWGTFFKSAALERNYRRLWSLGACRGSNKAITVPVGRNKVLIDRLPEQVFRGIVRHAAGTNAGGVIAFSEQLDDVTDSSGSNTPVFFAQLHPAGATPVAVSGRVVPAFLAPGMTIRLRATCNERGQVAEAPAQIEIVTPPADFTPDPVRPGRRDTIVGRVVGVRSGTLQLSVSGGEVRRVMVPLVDETVVVVDASTVELVAPGDVIEAKGRLWNGAGAAGAGLIFASRVAVTKPASMRGQQPLAASATRTTALTP